jgi:inorganic phosphate transporter, PiT family
MSEAVLTSTSTQTLEAQPRWITAQALREVGLWFLALAAAVVAMSSVPRLQLPIGLLLVAAVAYVNGSNDIAKSIATCVGSGALECRQAVRWGTFCTLVGAVASVFTATALVKTFSSGLLASSTPLLAPLAIGAVVGAAGWVFFATRTGLPVSTTHALTGSIVATALVLYGTHAVKWPALTQKVALPLLLSPFLGLVLAALLVLAFKLLRLRAGLNAAHWLASGTTAAARGMNDTPKIVGVAVLFLLAAAHGKTTALQNAELAVLVAAVMCLGSYLGGMRVIDTLACRVTEMDGRQGTAANLVTAALVTAATLRGLPVSTTHVSGGSIVGIGVAAGGRGLNLVVVRDIVLAWLITLPGAGIIAVAASQLATLISR